MCEEVREGLKLVWPLQHSQVTLPPRGRFTQDSYELPKSDSEEGMSQPQAEAVIACAVLRGKARAPDLTPAGEQRPSNLFSS